MTLDRYHRFFRWQAEPAADRVDDSGIRLVRHQPIDIGPAEAVCGQGLIDDLAQMLNRLSEDLAPLHPRTAGAAGGGRPAVDIEDVVLTAIGMQMRGQDAPVGR